MVRQDKKLPMLLLSAYWALGIVLPCVLIGVFIKPIWGFVSFPLLLVIGERGYRLLRRFLQNNHNENDDV